MPSLLRSGGGKVSHVLVVLVLCLCVGHAFRSESWKFVHELSLSPRVHYMSCVAACLDEAGEPHLCELDMPGCAQTKALATMFEYIQRQHELNSQPEKQSRHVRSDDAVCYVQTFHGPVASCSRTLSAGPQTRL